MEGLELTAFEIISAVGTARSDYIESIQKAKEGKFDEAEQLIKGSNMGLDTLSKNINNPKGISVELLEIAKDFVTFMNDSLQELRKWL